jgi:hypothetical protein
MSLNRFLCIPLYSLATLLIIGCGSTSQLPSNAITATPPATPIAPPGTTTAPTFPAYPSAPAGTTAIYAVVPEYNLFRQLIPIVWRFPAIQSGAVSDNVDGFIEIDGTYVATGSAGVYALNAEGLELALLSLACCGSENSSINPASVVSMAVGPTGEIFFSDGKGVTVFDDAASMTPSRYITGQSQSGAAIIPGSITVDTSGDLYVENTADASIAVFAPTANGLAVPVRTIGGPLARLASAADSVRGLTTDASGNLYVLCNCTRADTAATDYGVFEFDPAANGNGAPIRFVTAPAMTPIGTDGSVAVDSAGTLYVDVRSDAATQTIFQFPAGVSGSVAPSLTSSFPAEGDCPLSIAVY